MPELQGDCTGLSSTLRMLAMRKRTQVLQAATADKLMPARCVLYVL